MAIKIALAGNPNCGKTTLFNALTGSNQFVGNWPGVTVEKKEGKLKGHKDVTIMDLPGIYSLSPYTLEEVVARNYLINERPDAILNIVDGTNIERNLYLSTQIMELGIPVIMAVNMMDIVEKNGDKIHIDKLAKKLGCEVVTISALKGTGIKEAADKAVQIAQKKGAAVPVHEFDKDVEAVIRTVESKLGSDIVNEQKRFFAIKLLEKDDKITEQMKSVPDVSAEIKQLEDKFDDDTESIITNERYVYISSIIGDCVTKNKKNAMTTSDKIDRIVTNRWLGLPIFAVVMYLVYYIAMVTVGSAATDWANDGLFGDGWHLFGIGTSEYTEVADNYTAASEAISAYYDLDTEADDFDPDTTLADMKAVQPASASATIEVEDEETLAMNDMTVYYDAIPADADKETTVGMSYLDAVTYFEENGFDEPDPADYGVWVPGIPVLVENGLNAIHSPDWLNGLILDGIVGGVGAVLGFVPQMLVLFIFLAFLESCGYMARIAFVMDRIFRKFGLSGKSFIPMLIGTGCGVPGIMASRTIENDRDRKMTVMTTTFIPCGAKLPIIAMIATALFHGAWWVAPSAYFLGAAAIVVSGIMLKKTKMFAGDPAPFVMELPAYHWPTVGNILRSMWERGWSFIKKAGTIILLSSIVMWLGSVFGVVDGKFVFDLEMELDYSLVGRLGNAIKFIFAPLGFDNARAAIATVMGLVAKEEVVGVFGVLDFVSMTKLAGYCFLIFNLLCAPCFAAIGAMKREMNNAKWTWFAIGYQCCFAYAISLIVYQLGCLFTGHGNVLGIIVAVLLIGFICYMLFRPYKEAEHLSTKAKALAQK